MRPADGAPQPSQLGFEKCLVGTDSPRPSAGAVSAAEVLLAALDDPTVAEYSLVIVCLCPLTLFADFVKAHGEKAARKIRHSG